ncbi:MAG: pyridoxine 5'-phosphate synthase [Proteobacteria bacterium]|jgi:pyridoxine 5-phosphate synthase|nr:pyridoxine 5'-phosphate synthase [Pseudomonadota bacterium]
MIRLGVNIDHIATIRNARGEPFPSVIEAALVAETNGADLITVHLREDRRHIKDDDVFLLRQTLKTQLNLEMAATQEMLEIALEVRPDFVCLVPEKRQELTTEGGLDVINNFNHIANIIKTLHDNKIWTSIFIDPDSTQITAAREANAYAIEIHTGKYAQAKNNYSSTEEFFRIKDMAELADSLELIVNAGHGLNYHNVQPIARLPQMHELNIGYAIIAQSVFAGLPNAVSKMKQLMLMLE